MKEMQQADHDLQKTKTKTKTKKAMEENGEDFCTCIDCQRKRFMKASSIGAHDGWAECKREKRHPAHHDGCLRAALNKMG